MIICKANLKELTSLDLTLGSCLDQDQRLKFVIEADLKVKLINLIGELNFTLALVVFVYSRSSELCKMLHYVLDLFCKGICQCSGKILVGLLHMTKAFFMSGGVKKIPGISYHDSSEYPRRSRQFAWRVSVQMSKSTAHLALQVFLVSHAHMI